MNTTSCVGLNSQPVGSVLFFFIFQALKFLHEKGIPYGKYCIVSRVVLFNEFVSNAGDRCSLSNLEKPLVNN